MFPSEIATRVGTNNCSTARESCRLADLGEGGAARDYCFVIASINNTAIDPIAVASQTPPTRARLHRAARDLWLCDWLYHFASKIIDSLQCCLNGNRIPRGRDYTVLRVTITH